MDKDHKWQIGFAGCVRSMYEVEMSHSPEQDTEPIQIIQYDKISPNFIKANAFSKM